VVEYLKAIVSLLPDTIKRNYWSCSAQTAN